LLQRTSRALTSTTWKVAVMLATLDLGLPAMDESV
jgi:hypothetical protein